MRLADFIQQNMEAILADWEAFAATLHPAAANMTPRALRDDAADILRAIAKDMATPQTRFEQAEKSRGWGPTEAGAPETAAQIHAVLRARKGFDINQVVAEYRALRASVLRLWMDACPPAELGVDEIIRFNEAIDEAMAGSVGHFHAEVERARNLFLGMLGHDMRNPLDAIVITASYLASINAGEKVSAAAARLIRSGEAMRGLLDDLVDFSRTQLGVGIKVAPSEIDLEGPLMDELDQLRAVHSHRRIECAVHGQTRGCWDGARIRQILRNLVSNAVRHGSPAAPVRVSLQGGDDAEIRLEVTNSGSDVDPAVRDLLLNPARRGIGEAGSPDTPEGLGLGLFIVQALTGALGGRVDMRIEGGETTFAVYLPRR